MNCAMAITQGERKFVPQQEKDSLAQKKELGELDKNVTSLPPRLFRPPRLIHFAVFSFVIGICQGSEYA